uniref:putative disease resistance protein RGA3 n=1 Tax=Erigeron canadensis TaxID=72917 RepID=UPI001CB8A6E6|nr:putative disease resistance protein RGA3 [Erigeron canadensis]
MADDLIRVLITQATSILIQHVQHEFTQLINVQQDFETLITTLESIRAIIIDAEMKEIQNPSVKIWVKNLKLVSYEIDDTLTDWAIAAREVNGNTSKSNLRTRLCLAFVFPCVSSNQVAPLRKLAKKIRRINQTLVSVDNQKNAFGFAPTDPVDDEGFGNGTTCCIVEPSTVIGRDDEKDHLLSKLLTNEESSSPPIVFIWGMGGIGKTTLAQLIFNSVDVQTHFKIKKWVPVGRTSDVTRIAKAIVEGVGPNGLPLENVRDFVNQKKYLLVLDNVWEEDVNFWKPLFAALNGGAPGSKILITSRNEGVGKTINAIRLFSLPSQENQTETAIFMHHLGKLSDENTWTIFRGFAFAGKSSEFKESLEDIGRKISDKCKGLPLAAETVGSFMVLKDTKDEWEHVLNENIWQLEEPEARVSNPLLLSYYALPSPMKRCFCYCANFPKDTRIDAVNLIQIWMAQGYLGSDGNSEVELTGRRYLNSLVRRSLFQDPERSKDDGTVVSFKMHDMVHDVASYLMENECLLVTGSHHEAEDRRTYHHLTITHEDEGTFPIPTKSPEALYTFSIQSFHDCPQIIVHQDCVSLPPKIFNHFKYLKTLDMSRNMLLTIPDDIEKLKNLCYLNLSYNPLSILPETVCNLLNLQTLKLVACHHLTELPHSIGKLEKLRHLDIDQANRLVTLPKGVGKLTSLRTLSQFLIGTEDASCSLGDLKHLNHLRGRLEIAGLNQANVSEAKEAELEKKEHLVDLHINCSLASGVIDVLQLNTNLVALHIDQYGGERFPSWLAFLTNLKKLRLQEWANCIGLPPLGKLPSLKILHIEGFKALTHVGSEFLGVETEPRIGEASTSSIIAFPKLEKLKFSQMEKWEKWNMMKDIKAMPCLHYLKLSHCKTLQSLPLQVIGLPIKKLRIRSCVILKQRYQKETGKERETVSHIPNVRIL